ncbi:hypothetical protein [Noviherbaspirillum galbum]|uniref:Uncharacterized protein n=1 Tax=Noviherbaspirillum galbum TaxID=2709383 RepID=A0A6B3SJG2_9BURK|nr:hypothetical protein [Noviherbaspirillum galbum]NEX59495.1 hypothetical protein [Noviherbaspirillum galbum]
MPSKREQGASATVIKWTEEEWRLIAARLVEMKGRALLASPQLEEVKARDIFEAQDVLPADRHRKLISISQGVKATRQHVQKILSGEGASQAELLDDDALSGEDDLPQEANETEASAAPSASSAPVTSRAPVAAGADDEASAGEEEEQDDAGAPAMNAQAARPAAPVAHDTRPAVASAPAGADARPQHRQARAAEAASRSAAAESLVELARPFVAMVCEELASALVKAMANKDNAAQIGAFLQAANIQSGRPAGNQRDEQRGWTREPAQAPAPKPQKRAEPDDMPFAAHGVDEEDPHLGETDVQPLFDPKLPPSANSAYKPIIALIGISAADADDLRRRYPQFELKVVGLEDLRTEPSLRNCQRMVGLRETVPAPADEFLRKTFRHRYVRVTGGIGQLHQQLNGWLTNPVSMNTGPSRPPKPQNGKGQGGGGGGGYAKKRQFRRSKPTP